MVTSQQVRAATRHARRTGKPVLLASGEHDGVAWRHEANAHTDYFRLAYQGQERQTTAHGKTPQQAAEQHKADVEAVPARQAMEAAALNEANRMMLARDRERAAEPLHYFDLCAAYHADTGSHPSQAMLVRWAYDGPNEADRNAHWYQQGVKDQAARSNETTRKS